VGACPMQIVRALVIAGACAASWSLSIPAMAAEHVVNCDAGEKIQAKLNQAQPGDVINVSGTCNESVQVASEMVRVSLVGRPGTVINAPSGQDGIFIRGRDITVRGFTVTGGRDGIHLSGQGAGASAVIEKNVVRKTGRRGIHLDQKSVARIGDNVIEDVPTDGIDINESSNARIGYVIFEPLPNTIRNVGGHGIVITAGSTARILGNTIAGNKGSGILVSRNSQADVWSNGIADNSGDGIRISEGSGIAVSGATMPKREGENQTDAAQPNGGFGVNCSIGGYVNGPIGKLLGKRGDKSISAGCIEQTGS
jgi:nitrous oxidase accessory protein NosD